MNKGFNGNFSIVLINLILESHNVFGQIFTNPLRNIVGYGFDLVQILNMYPAKK